MICDSSDKACRAIAIGTPSSGEYTACSSSISRLCHPDCSELESCANLCQHSTYHSRPSKVQGHADAGGAGACSAGRSAVRAYGHAGLAYAPFRWSGVCGVRGVDIAAGRSDAGHAEDRSGDAARGGVASTSACADRNGGRLRAQGDASCGIRRALLARPASLARSARPTRCCAKSRTMGYVEATERGAACAVRPAARRGPTPRASARAAQTRRRRYARG